MGVQAVENTEAGLAGAAGTMTAKVGDCLGDVGRFEFVGGTGYEFDGRRKRKFTGIGGALIARGDKRLATEITSSDTAVSLGIGGNCRKGAAENRRGGALVLGQNNRARLRKTAAELFKCR